MILNNDRFIDDLRTRPAAPYNTAPYRWTPSKDTFREEKIKDAAEVSSLEREREIYGEKLKKWVDMQVDANLQTSSVMRSFADEVTAARQDSISAIDLARRQEAKIAHFEDLLVSLDDQVRLETMEVQKVTIQETLEAVAALVNTIDELKQTVAQQELAAAQRERDGADELRNELRNELRTEIEELRRLHGETYEELRRLHGETYNEHEKRHEEHVRLHGEHRDAFSEIRDAFSEFRGAFSEIRLSQGDHKRDLEHLHGTRKEHEQKILTWRDEVADNISSDIGAVESTFTQQLKSLQREVRGHIEAELEALRAHFAGVAKQRDLDESRLLFQSDLEDMRLRFEKSQRRLGDDLLAHQQTLISELRAETTAAVKNEAAAVTALDEQLWLCDQRLGQRIDKVQRDFALSVDDVVRSHHEAMRVHQESMSALKGIAQTHIRTTRSRSPEPRSLSGFVDKPLWGRELKSITRRFEEFAGQEVEGTTGRSPRSPRSLQVGSLASKGRQTTTALEHGHANIRNDDSTTSRRSSVLTMAREAGDAFADIASSHCLQNGNLASKGGQTTTVWEHGHANMKSGDNTPRRTSTLTMAREAGDAFADIASSRCLQDGGQNTAGLEYGHANMRNGDSTPRGSSVLTMAHEAGEAFAEIASSDHLRLPRTALLGGHRS